MVKELSKWKFTGFVGLNTLFVALCNSEAFRKLDFSHLKVTLSGGLALQLSVAERWKTVTGCPICEGYGMTETSPVASVAQAGAGLAMLAPNIFGTSTSPTRRAVCIGSRPAACFSAGRSAVARWGCHSQSYGFER